MKRFILLFFVLVVPASLNAAVGPFTWAINFYHSAVHALNAPVDVVEYTTGEIYKGAKKLDYWLDVANGEDQAVKTTKAQAKLAKKIAKQIKISH